MKSPVFASLWPRRTPFFIPKWMKGFLAKIWIKIVQHLTHIPLADTHAPPQRARKWRPDHGEAMVPSVSMATPVPRCQLTLCLMKWFVVHLSLEVKGERFSSYKATTRIKKKKNSICEFEKHWNVSAQLQKIVWEVCFGTYMCHVVLQSGLRGIIPLRNLLAPSWPASSAICCYQALSHRQPGSSWASTGLLKLCCHEDKRERRCSSLTRDLFSTCKQVLISYGVCMQTMFYIYAYML